jgi:uncharacterized protein (UPF0261 family)
MSASSQSGKTIVIVCNLDTRGEEIVFVKDLIRGRGHQPLLIDFSMEEEPSVQGDITCEEVALRGGLPIATVREYYRSKREVATDNQIAGVSAIVLDLLKEKRLHGVIGIGGATSTLVSTAVMQRLPFGLPKVMATPMAGHPRYAEKGVGTRDVTMHNTVLDIVKMNPLLEAQIVNAVGAICGMVEMSRGLEFRFERPLIAISSFGFAEMTVQAAVGMLEEAGFTPVVCHAQGKGDRAMEEMIADGMFAGVLDICAGGVIEHICGGNRDPGPDRLMAAARRGIPAVLAPCGFDFLSYGGREDKLRETAGRARYQQDSFRVQVRTTAEELRLAADAVAERLNRSTGPFTFLVPLRGWSSASREGSALFDPAADAAFVERLRAGLANKDAIKEVDLNLYSPEFARVAVDEFIRLYKLASEAAEMAGQRG